MSRGSVERFNQATRWLRACVLIGFSAIVAAFSLWSPSLGLLAFAAVTFFFAATIVMGHQADMFPHEIRKEFARLMATKSKEDALGEIVAEVQRTANEDI